VDDDTRHASRSPHGRRAGYIFDLYIDHISARARGTIPPSYAQSACGVEDVSAPPLLDAVGGELSRSKRRRRRSSGELGVPG
jgi:hypothetical protein